MILQFAMFFLRLSVEVSENPVAARSSEAAELFLFGKSSRAGGPILLPDNWAKDGNWNIQFLQVIHLQGGAPQLQVGL